MTLSTGENSTSDDERPTQSTMSTITYPPKPADVSITERYIDYFNYTDARLDELELCLEPRGISVDLYMGYCVRLKPTGETENKVYMNICHCDELPPPSEDLVSVEKPRKEDFVRLAVSVSEPHLEEDETGGFCEIFDVAVNSVFFWNIVVNSVSCQKVIVIMAIDLILKRFNVAVSPYVMGSMNVPFKGSVYPHYIKRISETESEKSDKNEETTSVQCIENPEIYYKDLLFLLLNISDDPNARCPCGSYHNDVNGRHPPGSYHNDVNGRHPPDTEVIPGMNPSDTEDIHGINLPDTADIPGINPPDTEDIPVRKPPNAKDIRARRFKRRIMKSTAGTLYVYRKGTYFFRQLLLKKQARARKKSALERETTCINVNCKERSLPKTKGIPFHPRKKRALQLVSEKPATVWVPVYTGNAFGRSETVFETDKKLAENVLKPKSVETFETTSSSASLPNQNQTKIKSSNLLRDYRFPARNSNNRKSTPNTKDIPALPPKQRASEKSATVEFPVNLENKFVRSKTVFETDSRLVQNVLEPKSVEAFEASSFSTTMSNRNQTKIKSSCMRQDYLPSEETSKNDGKSQTYIKDTPVRPTNQRVSEKPATIGIPMYQENTFVRGETVFKTDKRLSENVLQPKSDETSETSSPSSTQSNQYQMKVNFSRRIQDFLHSIGEEIPPHLKNIPVRPSNQRVSGKHAAVGSPVYPDNTFVRSETVFQTDKRLAENLLEPKNVDTYQASTSSATLPNRNPTKIKLPATVRSPVCPDNTFVRRETMFQTDKRLAEKLLEPRSVDISQASTSGASLPNRNPTPFWSQITMPNNRRLIPIPPSNQIRVSNHPIKIPDPPTYYPIFTYMLGPEGKYFDLSTYFAVLMCEDKSKDTPNMAYIRNIRSMWGDNHHIIQGILNPYQHLKGDINKKMHIFGNSLRPFLAKKLPSFSFNLKTDDSPNPVSDSVDDTSTLSVASTVPTLPTLIPGSKNLYAFTETPLPSLPWHLSPAPEIRVIEKKGAERRLTKLMQGGRSGNAVLKSPIELYDAGEIYLFITTASTRKYKDLNVFVTVDRIIAFKKGTYFTEVKLPKPVISKRGRAHVCNNFLMIVLPIASNEG